MAIRRLRRRGWHRACASRVLGVPPKSPGSLPEEHYWAILAFDLKANGIDLGDKKLDGELAKTLEIPRKK